MSRWGEGSPCNTDLCSVALKSSLNTTPTDHVQDPALAQAEAAKKSKEDKKEQTKQAVIPKSVLKDLLKASDTELEGIFSGLNVSLCINLFLSSASIFQHFTNPF